MSVDSLNEKIKKLILNNFFFQEAKYHFEPLEIHLRLGSPVMLTYPWINFDGLIAHLLAMEILGDLFSLLPSRTILTSMESLPIPLKKLYHNEEFIYHGSISRFSKQTISKDTIYKRIAPSDDRYLDSKKRKFYITKGDFKYYSITFIQNNSPDCFFYCNGDLEKLSFLLERLDFLGKKRAIGKGKVLSFSINSLDKDHSFFHPKFNINRPIPIEFTEMLDLPHNFNSQVAVLAYKIPYWNKKNHKVCLAPGGL